MVLVVTDAVFTVKFALVELAATITDAGTVAAEALLDKVTVVALNAAELSPTVHVDVAGGVSVDGLQLSVDRVGAAG